MFRQPTHCRWILALSLAALAPALADAQDAQSIQWRTDYNAARREADAKKLPVFIDFVRPNCPPCLKMEQHTFTDPRIQKTLNEKFVPLRINGVEEITLASQLGIEFFPTLVLAGPDGRIANKLIGFQDADALHEQLTRLLVSIAPSDTMKSDYASALKWEADGEYARALGAIRGILDQPKSQALHQDAKELLRKIEKRADERLAHAKALHSNGKPAEALDALTELRRVYPGVNASKEAADLISKLVQANAGLQVEQRTRRARDLLAQAKDFYKTKDFLPCLDRCEIILADFGDLPEGQQAFSLAAEIKNNPEWLQAAADVMTDRLGGVYLALADSYLKRGELQRAQFYLQRVLQAFPGSRMAESAQIRLTQIQATTPKNNPQSARP